MLFDSKYEFIKLLGAGGFGKVFLAREKHAERLVAIKQLNEDKRHIQEYIIREIEMVAKFNHPNIVTYYTHFRQNENLHFVMEYCEGGSLLNLLSKSPLPEAKVFEWSKQLAQCLGMIHGQGVIHCDLKPANILFTKEGTIKISDFGIANSGMRTIVYRSPDEMLGESGTSPRTDIYSLGLTLIEMLTGQMPFTNLHEEQILARHRKKDYGIDKLPGWQQEIILKAIHPVPELRFQYMAEFSDAVEAKAVPVVFSADGIKAAKYIERGVNAMKLGKWRQALKFLEYVVTSFPNNIEALAAYGRLCLQTQQIEKAEECISKVLKLNPRYNIQKELGWIKLEQLNYPMALALLSDHLHRHSADLEAYNLLLRCYYESGRYKHAMDLGKMIHDADKQAESFLWNAYAANILMVDGQVKNTNIAGAGPFLRYNLQVITENNRTYSDPKPLLKSKLLFMEHRFEKMKAGTLTLIESSDKKMIPGSFTEELVTIGREGYANTIEIPAGLAVSRRHCVIVNEKNAAWVYDMDSTVGTFLNGERVNRKAQMIGRNVLKIGPVELVITTDKHKLL